VSEGNGNTPELPRYAPSAPPLWFLDDSSVDHELVVRTARIEGLKRAIGEQREDEQS
jgi:hypothetical protein